jgi:NAD(P)H-hydrate epimerase
MELRAGFYDGRGSQALDELARQGIPVAGFDLMRRAARASLSVISDQYPMAGDLLVVCGKGNNAGDGYLVAALAREQGMKATVLAVSSPRELENDAFEAHAEAERAGVEIVADVSEVRFELYDVIIDALLGTGFQGDVRPAYRSAIEVINTAGRPVVSIDLPSGVNASTGEAQLAVRADHTVTFISRKVGVFTGPGRAKAGSVHLADLGVPSHLYPDPVAYECRWEPLSLEPPALMSYKHQRGHVLVAGGDLGMPGAVAMAAEAALRTGAGMVSIATRPAHASAMLARIPEAMTLDPQAAGFSDRLQQMDLIVLGPGLGRQGWGLDLFETVEATSLPVVLDADGLFWLAQRSSWSGGPLFLTPHAAEAARLLAISVQQVESDRLSRARQLGERFQARVDLKGPGSVVALLDRIEVCVHGNPGMATAGMGDVLSGIVGGVLAEAIRAKAADAVLDDLFSAAIALHSAAADLAAREIGTRSLIATDVVRALPTAIRVER